MRGCETASSKETSGDHRVLTTGEDLGFYEEAYFDSAHRLRHWMANKVPVKNADPRMLYDWDGVDIGELTFESPVRIDGRLVGDVTSSSTLIVGEEGSVEAEVKVGSLIIMGHVTGQVVAQDLIVIYMPLLGATPAAQFCTIVVRPRAGQKAEILGPTLSRAVADLDSNLPTYFPGTPARFHHEILSGNRLIATLFTIFGIVAFVLSAVGLYGVMSFSVNQRTQEFGIRMALGADARRIFRMVMTQGAWQLAIGLVLGAGGIALLLGVVAAAALKNILFKVNALDPTIYFAVGGLLTLVAALSCFVPARRATRVDPMVALRYE